MKPFKGIVYMLLLFVLCSRNIDAFVYSCEEVRYRIINTSFSQSTTYVCVVPRADFTNWYELSKIYVQDDTAYTSFETIAKSEGKCLSYPSVSKKTWTIVGEDTMDCSQEFSLIFTSDDPAFFYVAEYTESSVFIHQIVLVVPQINMYLHVYTCSGDGNITIYTGAGIDESEERYLMNSWTCKTLPQWIIAFDNVISIYQDPGMDYTIHYSSKLYTTYNPASLSPADRIAVLASGRSDNLQARPNIKYDDYAANFKYLYNQNISMNMQLTWDHTYSKTSSVHVRYDNNDIGVVDQGHIVKEIYAQVFQITYEPVERKANEIWNSDDNVVIEFSLSYDDVATTSTSTPTVPTTTRQIGQDPYCNCAVDKFGFASDWDYNDIWLDVVVILDTSEVMGEDALRDASLLIESFISDGFDDFLITDTAASLYTRVGVISMSDTAQVLYNLNMTKNDKVQGKVTIKEGVVEMNVIDAFDAAMEMFADGLKSKPDRSNTRQVVYYMTDSNPGNNLNATNQFKTSKGIIIVNNFLQEDEVEQPGLKNLASDGYYFPNSNYMQALQAFCKANCFCPSDLDTYGGSDPAIQAAGGCYHPTSAGVPFNKAKTGCSSDGGIIATDHDEKKGQFLSQLMAKASSKSDFFWIGFEKADDGVWQWEDQSTDPYTNWDLGEPSSASVAKCAYVDQSQGNLPWGAGNCQLGFPYVCEYAPCSVGNKNC